MGQKRIYITDEEKLAANRTKSKHYYHRYVLQFFYLIIYVLNTFPGRRKAQIVRGQRIENVEQWVHLAFRISFVNLVF